MRFGLVGYPLSHSFSKPYFTEKFAQLGLSESHVYVNFELEHLTDFPAILHNHPDLGGLNVTIPHKEAVIPYLDELSPEAKVIGAVNTIVVKEGKTVGHNTDVLGFRSDFLDFLDLNVAKPSLESNDQQGVFLATNEVNSALLTATNLATLKSQPEPSSALTLASLVGKKALVLGTGGASLAIHYALNELGIETTPVSRTPKEGQISYTDLSPKRLLEYTFVINTTPLGMYPKVAEKPDLPYAAFSVQHYCYDLVYNPELTLFLRTAASHGANVRNGLGMLHGQAEAAWSIWNSSPTKKNQL